MQTVTYCFYFHVSLHHLLDVAAQGSATRAANNSVRPDLLSLSISMQQSLSTSASSSQSVIHSSAPVISTARPHRIDYSNVGNLTASGYSLSSQALSGVQMPCAYTPGLHEGTSRLFEPAAIQSVTEEPRPPRPAEWPASEAQDDSELAVVPCRDDVCDETEDDSSMLSLSVSRLVRLTIWKQFVPTSTQKCGLLKDISCLDNTWCLAEHSTFLQHAFACSFNYFLFTLFIADHASEESSEISSIRLSLSLCPFVSAVNFEPPVC